MHGSKIPATIITGFLGAGKTTIIRELLANAGGRRIALIINEFGDMGFDGEVLKGCGAETCSEDDIVELTNGCICCTVADDFIPTMTALLEREKKPDHIIIETSGLALPQPLVAAFNWPEIKTRVTVDGVITVVDGAAIADGRFAHDHAAVDAQRQGDESLDHETPLEELFDDQLGAADMIVLSKSDLIDGGENGAGVEAVKDTLRGQLKRRTPIIVASGGQVSPDLLLGLGAATEDDITNRPSHHDLEGEDHDHDEFESMVFEGGDVADPRLFLQAVKKAIEEYDILRVKGFCAIAGKPMRLVVQAVGSRLDSYHDRPFADDETRRTKLVVIGHHDFDQSGFRAALESVPEPVAG